MPASNTIDTWLSMATERLQSAEIPSARLDAEVILAHTLHKSRTYLHAHGDDTIDSRSLEILDARLGLRSDRVPVAYIIGHKEFYGRQFKVTTATLIPRPESETAIELLNELIPANASLFKETKRLIDVGTGSGCLGITAKLEHPELQVYLSDVSRAALNVAQRNASHLKADVEIIKSDLLNDFPFKVDYIIANLPYVDEDWERSPETNHEPASALFASRGGLSLIYKLLAQAPQSLRPGGYMLIEADPEQHAAIKTEAASRGLSHVKTSDYYVVLVLA